MSESYAANLHRIEENAEIPAWCCEAVRRSDLKRVAFWLRGSQLQTAEQARIVAAMAFVHLECSENVFKAERRYGEGAPVNRKPVPVDWFLFGTDRMKAEIDAGLRPFSEYLLPPLAPPAQPKPILRAGTTVRPASILHR